MRLVGHSVYSGIFKPNPGQGKVSYHTLFIAFIKLKFVILKVAVTTLSYQVQKNSFVTASILQTLES